MRPNCWKVGRARGAGICIALMFSLSTIVAPAQARTGDNGPIRIGVIAPFALIPGKAIINGAELAVDEINATGGINGRKVDLFKYDDHFSASDAVRAFQGAVEQHHVVAMLGVFSSEVGLALMPWASRLHVPALMSGPASTTLLRKVHDRYRRNKYSFEMWLNSDFMAQAVCDFAKDDLVPRGAKTAVVVSEDAAWTKPLDRAYSKCLPRAGLRVLDVVTFSRETSDFTPVFEKIQAMHPGVVMTGWAHVGVKPMVQWHALKIPAVLAGIDAQSEVHAFWKATNGGANNAIALVAAVPGERLTPKTTEFISAYLKRFHVVPAAHAYATYSAVYVLKQAIERARSTRPNALVTALEKTDYTGPYGRIEFYGRKSKYAHGVMYGRGYITTSMMQWQNGKQVAIWPGFAATARPALPSLTESAAR